MIFCCNFSFLNYLINTFIKRSKDVKIISCLFLDKNSKAAPPPNSIIQDLVSPEPYSPWLIRQWLDIGDEQFTFPFSTFRSLPPELFGAEWLQTAGIMAKIAGPKKISFKVSKDADVFVSYGSLPNPGWLNEFVDIKDSIENSKGKVYRVYKKRFPKNAVVRLEVSQSDMYNVFAVPVSNMEPAYDLKPVTSYKAVNANLFGAVQKGMVDGKERAIFSKAFSQNAVEWNISVGVADMYSLTISYNSPHNETVKGKLQFFAADGTLMKEEIIEFTATKPGKSNYINSSTGTMINAGNYKVRLLSNTSGISINSLDVQ